MKAMAKNKGQGKTGAFITWRGVEKLGRSLGKRSNREERLGILTFLHGESTNDNKENRELYGND